MTNVDGPLFSIWPIARPRYTKAKSISPNLPIHRGMNPLSIANRQVNFLLKHSNGRARASNTHTHTHTREKLDKSVAPTTSPPVVMHARAKTIARQNAGRASDHEGTTDTSAMRAQAGKGIYKRDRCNAIKTRCVHRHADCTLGLDAARPAIIAKSAGHACATRRRAWEIGTFHLLHFSSAIIGFLE